jgi:formylglycine-generating enzyme required for sulfatase activity
MPQITLRQLARAYARGELDKTSYRQQRANLLEGILKGDMPLKENSFLAPLQSGADESTYDTSGERMTPNPHGNAIPVNESVPPAQPEDAGLTKKSGLPLVAGTLGLGFILIILFTLYQTSPGNKGVTARGTETAAMTPGGHTRPGGRELIAAFLQKKSWTDESMANFVDDWSALPEDKRKATIGSVELGQLTNAIYKQLLAEQALAGLDKSHDAMDKQRELVEFARRIGIDDPRFSMPDAPLDQPSGDTDDSNNAAAGSEEDLHSSSTSCSSVRSQNGSLYCRDLIPATGVYAPTMVIVPSGEFIMGGSSKTEQPRHRVSIHYRFAISVHEITFGEFSRFCAMTKRNCPAQPWFGQDYPVVNITWHQAQDYTRWLTDSTGNHYRLPSEAEWEYAARAGTDTSYPTGDQLTHHDAVYSDNRQLNSPLPKTDRSIKRNPFQIYHMTGNVREWTLDNWHADYTGAPADGSAWLGNASVYRVVRGGSYADSSEALRSAARTRLPADSSDRYTGFRIVQDLIDRGS